MSVKTSTREQKNKLDKQMCKLKNKIESLQNECQHANKVNKGGSNDHDGWSINVNVTWYEHFYCPDCDKGWHTSKTSFQTY